MDKQSIHARENYSFIRKEQTIDTCSNLDKSQNNYAE